MAAHPVFLTQALLDAGKIPHGSQVRWIGLVRDVGQPQLMVDPTDDSAYIETTPHRCEVIPGRAPWLQEKQAALQSKFPSGIQRAGRSTGSSVLGKTKRSTSDDDDDEAACSKSDRHRPSAIDKKDESTISITRPSFQVIVRAYQGIQYKVNHVYEFVGELDLTPQALDDLDMEWQGEDATSSRNTAKLLEFIPTLHAKDATERDYACDVLNHVGTYESYPGKESNGRRIEWCLEQWKHLGYPCTVEEIREQLIAYLASSLQHDSLSAEFVALCLLSRVYQRSQVATPFGHFAVNLVFPKATPDAVGSSCGKLLEAIRRIVPMATSLNLSIESLCTTSFCPRKDYTIDYLHPGLLQLPDGAAVVVDESKMTTGTLNDQGTRNIHALVGLVETQTLTYDFQFYHTVFHQDVKFISMSTSKSILPSAVNVVRQATTTGTASTTTPPEALLQCFRLYIAVFRTLDVELGNDGAQTAEHWYVEARKADKAIGADDLHRLVRVARLVALSLGQSVVTLAAWQRALELDKAAT
ncbi:hypothetical protein H257_04113 [Aphanomyces astaci]|uniref:Mini-chromosome maintenance complex-binding protein n=1 Tax=Aphanomyces astaci TaxID=112090 RepID=W4GWG2_APHAT|nr:hypothetical protein H257_04113 [Aphanomyces astaci]ETV83369.1 hypothetical protein H257_04113 [Aphanomyces astaci]|eukprot:XP_009826799.1 hypothetical protein H257_04113 [Aphanomyces astaci]